MLRCIFAIGCYGKTDIQMYPIHCFNIGPMGGGSGMLIHY